MRWITPWPGISGTLEVMSDSPAPAHPTTDAPSMQWSSNPWWPTGGIVVSVVLAVSALRSPDVLGLVFLGSAALTLMVWSGIALSRRTGLTLVDDALVLRSTLRTRVVPLDRLLDVQVLEHRRLGLSAPVLRVEYRGPTGDAELEIFTRSDLDADPHEVVRALMSAGLVDHERGTSFMLRHH